MKRACLLITGLMVALGADTCVVTARSPSARAMTATVRWDARLEAASADDIAVEGSRVFVVGAGNLGRGNANWLVRALDKATGALLWQDQFDFEGGADGARAVGVHGGVVVAAGRVSTRAGNTDAFVRAYDATSGELRWQDRFDRVGQLDGFNNHALALGSNTVYIGGLARNSTIAADWLVRAYDLTTGGLLWQDIHDGGPSFDQTFTLAAHGQHLFAGGISTSVTADGTLISHFTVRAYDARSGALLWQERLPTGGPVVFFAVSDSAEKLAAEGNRLVAAGFIADDAGIHWAVRSYDAASGALGWSHLDDFGAGADFAHSVALHEGLVFAAGTGGPHCNSLVTSNCDGLVRSYDQETGALLWEKDVDVAGTDDGAHYIRAAAGHVLVAGNSVSALGGLEAIVVSLDAKTGAVEWVDRVSSSGDVALATQLTVAGAQAFVTGLAFRASGVQEAFVRAYDLQ